MSQSFFKPRKNFSKSRGRPHSANRRFRNQAQNYTYDQKNIGKTLVLIYQLSLYLHIVSTFQY